MEYQNVNMNTNRLREIVEAAVMEQAYEAGLSPYDPIVAKLKKRAIKSIETLEYYRVDFADYIYYEDFVLEAKYLEKLNEVVFQLTHISGNSSGWMSGKDLRKAAYALRVEDDGHDTTKKWLNSVAGYYNSQIQNRIELLDKRYTCKARKAIYGLYRLEADIVDSDTGLVLNVNCDAVGFYETFLPWFHEQVQNS